MGVFDPLMEPGLFTIRRTTPGPKDPLGKPTRSLVSETVVNGILDPLSSTGSSAEEVDSSSLAVGLFRATMPLGTDIRASDEVKSLGKVYKVEGTPLVSTIPRQPGIGVVTAALKYVGPAE